MLPHDLRQRMNTYAGLLMLNLMAFVILIFGSLGLPAMRALRVPVLYAIPVGLIFAIALVLQLLRALKLKSPLAEWHLHLAGWGFIVGGVIINLLAAALYSPDLSMEGNVVVRALREDGFSITWIYSYAILVQGLLLVTYCLLWSALLRHRHFVVELAWLAQPTSRSEFIKAAMGGEGVTWQAWFFSMSKAPGYYRRYFYHIIWYITAMVMGVCGYLWFLGITRFAAPDLNQQPYAFGLVMMVSTASAYIVWLSRQYDAKAKTSDEEQA
jgi:hypothetical protein